MNSRSPRRTGGSTAPPNFEGHAWNLRVTMPLERGRHGASGCRSPRRRRGSSARARRCSRRGAKRVRPGLDDKILTSWNALAIAGLARAARALDEPRFGDLARRGDRCAARHRVARRAPARDTRKDERAHLNAYLDDYAFLLAALLELMQTRFRPRGFRLGVRHRRPAARAVRGSRERRLLLHEPRSRAALPSHEARPRQRDALGQRRRRVGADRARASRGGTALRRGRRARGARVRRLRLRESPRRIFDAARGARGHALAAGVGAARGDPVGCAEWQRALERTLRPRRAHLQRRGRGACRPRWPRAPRPAAGAAAWVCRERNACRRLRSLADVERILRRRRR